MNKDKQKIKRRIRVRSRVKGTKERPRLSVFRSNKFIYGQLIDDEKGEALLTVSEKHLEKAKEKAPKTAQARAIGILLAKKAIEKKIKSAVFDRGNFLYHGRVKELAQGAREGGLRF